MLNGLRDPSPVYFCPAQERHAEWNQLSDTPAHPGPRWNFILHWSCKNDYHPSSSVKNDIDTQGIDLIDPGPKAGAVDRKLKELVNKFIQREKRSAAT